MQLLIATTNPGKIREIRNLLNETNVEILTPTDIGLELIVDETGITYQENAEMKAIAYHKASHLPVLADDSGLEVEALGGLPGIRSARFANSKNAIDHDRRSLLLQKLSSHPRPWKARFVCVATLLIPGKSSISKIGECKGEIIPEERGEEAFGYDPIFLVAGTQKTMAELNLQEKNRISHRAKAVQGLIPYLSP